MDKLDIIFERQALLDSAVQDNTGRMATMEADEKIQKKVMAMQVELAELLDEVNYKWWKNKKPVDIKKVHEELADILHFFISACITAGLSAQSLFEVYNSKNKENHNRQQGKSDKQGYKPD